MLSKNRHVERTPIRLGLIALLFAVGLTFALTLFPAHSFDVWWHLRTGQLILEEGSIPTADPFTYTATGRPWVTHEWLTEVVFHLLYRLGGIDALVVSKALLAALALGLAACASLIGPRGRDRLPAAALGVLLAAPLIAPRAFIRPHMLTAVLLGLLLLLLQLESNTGRKRYRLALIPLFLLWANLHSGFVLGLGVLAAFWIGEGVRGLLAQRSPGSTHHPWVSWKHRGAILLAAAAVTLLNPHHVHALLYPFRLIARGEVTETIVELRSIFHPAYRDALFLKVLAAGGLLTAGLLFSARKRVHWPILIPAVLLASLALLSLRSVSEFAVILPALIGLHGDRLGRHRAIAMATTLAVVLLAAVGGILAAHAGVPMGREGNRKLGLGIVPVNRPAAAVTFLRDAHPPGNVFHILAFGGYFIHELWPQRRVFIDGRLDVFAPGFLRAYRSIMDTGEGWDRTVEQYGISMAVVDYADAPARDQGLRSRLRNDSEWICVFCADNLLIYARNIDENQDILDRYGSPFDPSLRSSQSIEHFIANATAETLDQAIGAFGQMRDLIPTELAPAVVLGQLLAGAGRNTEAARSLAQAVEIDPTAPHLRLLLMQTLGKAGQMERAREQVSALLGQSSTPVEILVSLAIQAREAGWHSEAVEAMEQAVALRPEDVQIRLRAGAFNAERGDFPRARAHFRKAGQLRPGDPAVDRNMERLRQLEQQRRE